jgi:hypothetical protein
MEELSPMMVLQSLPTAAAAVPEMTDQKKGLLLQPTALLSSSQRKQWQCQLQQQSMTRVVIDMLALLLLLFLFLFLFLFLLLVLVLLVPLPPRVAVGGAVAAACQEEVIEESISSFAAWAHSCCSEGLAAFFPAFLPDPPLPSLPPTQLP